MAETDTLMHRWFEEVWNKRRLEAIDEMLAADCIIDGLPNANGRSAFKAYYQNLLLQFPEHLTIKVENVRIVGDLMYADCLVTGTHANGKPVDFGGRVEARVQDNMIVEAKNAFDFDKMEIQING